jgi:signal transduction histidine kinase
MNFINLNSKLCIMGNSIAWNHAFCYKIPLRAQLILLLVLLAFQAQSQEYAVFRSTPSMTQDTFLMRQYIEAGKKGSISPDSARKLLNQALVIAKKYRLQKKIGIIWNSIGGRMLQKKDFAGCKRYLDSAFTLNDELKDAELTCILNTQAAAMYQYDANYTKAASHYFRAVQAVEEHEIKNQRPVAVLYNNLAGLMIALNEDSLARKYLLLGRQHVLKMQPVDSALLINILVILGSIQPKEDSFAAIGYFKEANAMANKLNDISSSYMTLINLSRSYIKHQQYDSAQHYLNLAKTITQPVWISTMELVTGLLAYHRKDYTTAEKHLHDALAFARDEKYGELDVVYEALSDVYAARGEYQKAYTFHKKSLDQYRILTGDTKKTVADFMLSVQALEHEKAILQKQAEISSGEAAIKKQQFWIVTMCLVSVLLCIILIMAYRNYQNKKSLLRQQMKALLQDQEIERLKAEAEGADNERSRIAYDIHDGVLVRLANVKMNLAGLPPMLPEFAKSERYQDVVGQLDLATRELRNTAHNLMPEILLEEGMAQAIFYFCKATEQASGLNIKFQQVGSSFPRLQPQVETAIYRIVQGLLQNVIQHAEATATLVQLQYADHLCSITVEDDGKGINDVRKDEGYGIKSIRNRVKILRGIFDISSQAGQGTTAYFEFDARPFLQNSPGSR